MARADLVLALFLAALFASAAYEAVSFQWQAAAAPLLASLAGLLLTMVQVARSLTGGAARRPLPYTARDAYALLSFLAGGLAIVLLGFFWGGIAMIFVHVLRASGGRFPGALLACLPMLGLPLLERVLGVELFRGLLAPPVPL